MAVFIVHWSCLLTTKGQIISEQKRNKIIARISALASKMGQIKKIKAFLH